MRPTTTTALALAGTALALPAAAQADIDPPTPTETTLAASLNGAMTVGDQMEAARGRLRQQTGAMFAPELQALSAADRRTALAPVDALLQFESAEHLRVRLGFAVQQTNAILTKAVAALLA